MLRRSATHDIRPAMKELSWSQFDLAVAVLAERLAKMPTRGIYGVPRGGLCLAVALSHAMQQPLLCEPNPDALIVDDVYESGRTLQALQVRFPDAVFAVWVSKRPPLWWHAAEVAEQSEWLLFPWENAAQASADEQAYRASRRGSR
jgi:hypoxanthine phosphoribosyltransferase